MGAEKKVQSTLIGLKYPSRRDEGLRTGANWLRGRREDDGAEGLWRIGDKLYDLNGWIDKHPGGAEWLTLSKGIDITVAFESHHVNQTAERMLPKFYVRDAVTPSTNPYTFKPDGFYRKFKARAREALKGVDIHKPSRISNLMTDSLVAATVVFSLTASVTQSWIAILASGVLLALTSIAAHNYLHLRDNYRSYYLDMSMMSSKDWRITHVLSHHLYPNTLLDIEISQQEPMFQYLPQKQKGLIPRYLSYIYFPVLYAMGWFIFGVKRTYCLLTESGGPDLRDLMPFLLPTLMYLASPSTTAIVIWLKIMLVASFHQNMVGLNAAHHHPDIFHDGDVHRDDMDWGLSQLDAVRDRVEIQTSYFFVLTNYGSHALHHLLPTVDHAYLNLCEPALNETCKEFNVNTDLWTVGKLIHGQFQQLRRVQPKLTPNIR